MEQMEKANHSIIQTNQDKTRKVFWFLFYHPIFTKLLQVSLVHKVKLLVTAGAELFTACMFFLSPKQLEDWHSESANSR